MISKRKGFTLIELLVVIAIIGILSSVVLASLNQARARGADAAIKSNLAGIRSQAEIYYDTNGHYGSVAFAAGACATTANTLFADTNIAAQITAAASASSGGAMSAASCVSSTGGSAAWAVSVPLKTTTTNSWCVDSSGASKTVTPAGADRGFNGVACK